MYDISGLRSTLPRLQGMRIICTAQIRVGATLTKRSTPLLDALFSPFFHFLLLISSERISIGPRSPFSRSHCLDVGPVPGRRSSRTADSYEFSHELATPHFTVCAKAPSTASSLDSVNASHPVMCFSGSVWGIESISVYCVRLDACSRNLPFALL